VSLSFWNGNNLGVEEIKPNHKEHFAQVFQTPKRVFLYLVQEFTVNTNGGKFVTRRDFISKPD